MKVKFDGCEDEQANWGQGSDPRKCLTIGETYEVDDIEPHTWHTLYYLTGFDEPFNSVSFTEVE
ncbi:MAG: hypothetical protein ACTSSP_11520 [Candidatus Asgardarchaeia archaeon]